MAITMTSRLDLPTHDGVIDVRVPKGTYITDEVGRVYARPGQHVHGRRTRESYQMTVFPGLACDYCEAMRRIANGEVVES